MMNGLDQIKTEHDLKQFVQREVAAVLGNDRELKEVVRRLSREGRIDTLKGLARVLEAHEREIGKLKDHVEALMRS